MKIEIEMEILPCGECGVPIVAAPPFFAARRDDHQSFFCINGHSRYFPQKSEEQRLREELAKEKQQTTNLQEQLSKVSTPKRRGRPRKGS